MPSYPAVLKDYYNPEVQIFRGYWMISWFKKNFAQHLEKRAAEEGKSVEEMMNEEIASIPAGSDGLVLQPFWQAGLTTPEAKGAIIGFTDFHTRAHVYRAIIEGIDFARVKDWKEWNAGEKYISDKYPCQAEARKATLSVR